MHAFLRFYDRVRKGLRVFQRQLQNMERQTLGRLPADTGQTGKLIRQILQRRRKKMHTDSLEQAAQIQAAG